MKQIFTCLFLLSSLISFSQDGTPDISFGDNGKVVTDPLLPGVVNVERQKITVIAGNKIYQVFSYSVIDGAPADFGIMRYTQDGEPDASFGTNGVVITDMGANDVATSMVVLADGSFIVAGYSLSGINGNFALAKYDQNGLLVGAFGTGGKVTTTIGTQAKAYALQVRSDGKIIVAGFSRNAGINQVTIAQYETNGSLDLSFGTNGITTTSIGAGDSAAYGLALQTDGKIVVAGFAIGTGSNYVFAVARYTVAGVPDASFDTDGVLTTNIGGVDDAASAIVIQPDGKILVAGQSLQVSDYDLALVRYNPDGSPDAGFGAAGITLTDLNAGSDDFGTALQLQPDNKILFTGYTNTGIGSFSDFAIVRYTAAGIPDVSFGIGFNGQTIVDFGADEYAYSVALQGSYILLGGYKGASLALLRLNNSNVILPVKLLEFTANKKQDEVALQWTTSNENDALKFEIERSADGRNYGFIGTVPAKENFTSTIDYSFIDVQPLPVNLYRLKIINLDGSYTYSKIIVVRFTGDSELQAFPNPVINDLRVQLKVPAGKVNIQVMDIAGRIVLTQQVKSDGNAVSTSINMNNLKPGVYFLKVNERSIKIIKEN
jgi:uncharacterized delta-60 repeat protein